MSKSVGNVIDPIVIARGGKNAQKDPAYGVDVLRYINTSSSITLSYVFRS